MPTHTRKITHSITPTILLETVAYVFQASPRQIRSNSSHKSCVEARMAYSYFFHRLGLGHLSQAARNLCKTLNCVSQHLSAVQDRARLMPEFRKRLKLVETYLAQGRRVTYQQRQLEPPVVRNPFILLNAVCKVFSVTHAQLLSPCRSDRLVDARTAFWWHWRNNGFGSLEEAAAVFNRDPSTVSKALERATDRARNSRIFLRYLRHLHAELKRIEPSYDPRTLSP